MRRRSPARLGTALAVIISLMALAPLGATAATTRYVDMDGGYTFHAPTQTAARGDTIRWRVKAATPHDVKSGLSGYFTSPGGIGGMRKDGAHPTFSRTFKQAGTFSYVCRLHRYDGMQGKVVVPINVARSGSAFTIKVASGPTSGTRWRNKVQVRKPGSSAWTTIATTTAKSVTFTSSTSGTYQFRSAVKDATTGATSGYSPVVTATW